MVPILRKDNPVKAIFLSHFILVLLLKFSLLEQPLPLKSPYLKENTKEATVVENGSRFFFNLKAYLKKTFSKSVYKE